MKINKKSFAMFFIATVLCMLTFIMIAYEQLDNLEIELTSYKNNMLNIVTIILTAIALSGSVFIFIQKNISTEKVFLATVPIICLIFMIVMPPFTGHDESRHWLRAYEISEGNFITPINNKDIGSSLPESVTKNIGKTYKEIKYKDVIEFMKKDLNNDVRETTDMSTVAIYSPIQYFPEAIGIFVARLFSDKVITMVYAARLANVISCITLLYFAIKIIPFGKKVMLLPLLLPITIEGIATISSDGFTNAIAFLFIAIILRETYSNEEKIKTTTFSTIILLSLIISLCKIVYIPLVFLMLLLPKEKFKTKKKKYIILAVIIICAVIINLSWLMFANNTYLTTSSEGESSQKTEFILKNPIDYMKLFLATVNYNLQRYISILFGSILGWQEFSLYYITTYVFFLLFLFVSTTDSTIKEKIDSKKELGITMILLIIIGLIFTSLFVQYEKNHVDSKSIAGIQGRYFVPILPLVSILLSKTKITTQYKEKNINKLLGITTMTVYIYVFLSIMIVHL